MSKLMSSLESEGQEKALNFLSLEPGLLITIGHIRGGVRVLGVCVCEVTSVRSFVFDVRLQ